MGYGEPRRKVGRPATGHLHSSDRHTIITAERSKVDRVPCADPERRTRLEADPVKWMKHYGRNVFTRPFERPHLEIVAGVMRAHETQGRFVVAAERGCGKTVILWWMILYLLFTGRHRLPVCVTWADKALKRAFRHWSKALCRNPELAADYPEFCAPFVHAKGVPQRVATTRWRDTGEPCGCQLTVGEGMIVMPDSLGCIGGGTINGSIKGFNHTLDDGTVLRPTIVLMDDVQDRFVAKSPAQVADTIAGIDGDLASIGESGRDLPMLMAINCEHTGDVAEHYLTSREWHALRVPCIEAWPAGWEDAKSGCRKLWEEWHERFLNGKGDLTFYRKHKRELTKGMKLSAPAAFKGAQKCPDPLYGVMRMYHKMGHESFMAQRQQSPVDPVSVAGPYTLTPEVILSRVTQRKPWERPDWVSRVVASSDINPSYAFSTVVLGFGEDQSAAVLWYGVHHLDIPVRNMTAAEYARSLYPELVKHGQALAASPCRPGVWAVDAGGDQFDAIAPYVDRLAAATGVTVLAFTGRKGIKYAQYGQTVIKSLIREHCHGCATIKGAVRLRWVAWDSDYWGEKAQKAWLSASGAPGQASLPQGQHYELARQICNKRLLKIEDKGGKTEHTWQNVPGKQDFHDAMAQGYAVAAFGGIETSGRQSTRRENQRKRARGVTVIPI